MKKGKYFILGFIIIAVAIGIGYYQHFRIKLISNTVVTELGEPLSMDISDYATGNITHANLNISKVNVQKSGLYKAYITNGSKDLVLSVKVADTTPPSAVAISGLKFSTYEDVEASNLVTEVKDTSNTVSIAFKDGKKSHVYTVGGEINETVVLTDLSGNKNTLAITLQIIADTTAPVIKGVKPIKSFAGDDINYTKDITASDDRDGNLTAKIKINSENVNSETPGIYSIVYSVRDCSGNEAKKKTSITILKDQAPILKGTTNKTVYVNNKINYLAGVSATDDKDGNLTSKIKINNDNLNLGKAGIYKVVYTIIDSTGNKTSKTITVTVKKKEPASSERSKTSEPKNTEKSDESSNKSSSGSFKFHDVKPSGKMPNGDVPAGGKQDVGTWG